MTEPQGNFIELGRRATKVALAVRLLDHYSGVGEVVGEVSVSLVGQDREAIRNSDGFFVFTGLPPATYQLLVSSVYYLEHRFSATAGDPHDLLVTVLLKPNPAYPFSSAATLIRGKVVDADGKGIADAAVEATQHIPEAAVKAKLGPSGATVHDTIIMLSDVTAPALAAGHILMIKDANDARVEFCTIRAPLPAHPSNAAYHLDQPLRFSHPAATPLYVLWPDGSLDTRADSRGEFVVYFSKTTSPRFITVVVVSQAGSQKQKREVEVQERTLVSLGRIELKP